MVAVKMGYPDGIEAVGVRAASPITGGDSEAAVEKDGIPDSVFLDMYLDGRVGQFFVEGFSHADEFNVPSGKPGAGRSEKGFTSSRFLLHACLYLGI
jgi:hypothetical protein